MGVICFSMEADNFSQTQKSQKKKTIHISETQFPGDF